MSKTIKIKRGLDINLKGKAEQVFGEFTSPATYALKPTDFANLTPKMLVKEGQEVKAGDPLFYSKMDERILFCAPVSGEVTEIRRGAKRKILEVIILADKEVRFKEFPVSDPSGLAREEVIERLLSSGTWPFLVKRPYGVLANPDRSPNAIFISGFDTAPMAPSYDVILNGQEEHFATGIAALKRLTDGAIHLSVDARGGMPKAYEGLSGVNIHSFEGPHPAGNVGTQIHHISPMNKGEIIWTINPEDVVVLGRLFNEGKYNPERVVALTGSEVKKPRYFRITQGANLEQLFNDEVNEGNVRYISGDVLTGKKIDKTGFLGFFDQHLTVIPEGDYKEFVGWLSPGFNKFSMSRTFFSWLNPNKEYVLDTNQHGEERAFVITGELERVFPFDIYPMELLKSIMVGDIERMESLGIYEVVEEDFALCEVICTSKIEIQKTVSNGLRLMEKELG